MKKTLAILTITAAFSLGMLHPAIAAKSPTKDYQVSVALLETADVIPKYLSSKAKVISYTFFDPRQHTVITVIVQNSEVLPKTTVVQ